MKTERFDAWTEQGRRVAVWRNVPDAPATWPPPIVVLNAGFGRTMREVGSVALSLAHNGVIVYRFDSVDHIGLSDGGIVNYTVSGVYDSLRAAVELARSTEGRRAVRLVALSLSALAAYRLAAEDPDINAVVALAGVVNGRSTLHRVVGEDYTAMAYDDLPPRVDALGHEVDPRHLWLDNRATGCLSVERTIAYLSQIRVPVANFVASADPWVDIEECTQAFESGAGGPRTVVKLPYTGHDLGRNPVAISAMLRRLTEFVLRDAGGSATAIRMPSFDDLLRFRIAEREQEAKERAADMTERSAVQ